MTWTYLRQHGQGISRNGFYRLIFCDSRIPWIKRRDCRVVHMSHGQVHGCHMAHYSTWLGMANREVSGSKHRSGCMPFVQNCRGHSAPTNMPFQCPFPSPNVKLTTNSIDFSSDLSTLSHRNQPFVQRQVNARSQILNVALQRWFALQLEPRVDKLVLCTIWDWEFSTKMSIIHSYISKMRLMVFPCPMIYT